ncbi:MAG: peptidase S41 [Tannerella sp.]|jgi:hypothetical protein|nr:peptidase S41 [Tannerella sp.]
MKFIQLCIFSFLFILWGCSDSSPEKTPVTIPEEIPNIVINNYSSKEIKDLALLCKVWGFLKYYHPAVGAGTYNWDDELLIIMEKVLNTSSAAERNILLSEWIESLGALESTNDYVIPFSDEQIKYLPDLDWIENQTELGSDLSARLISTRNAYKQRTSNVYINHAPNVGNPQFLKEPTYYSMSYSDDGIKLIAIFRYWNMIEYFFPYKLLADEDWDEVLEASIPEFIDAKDALNYKLACLKLIGKINDTHANIYNDVDLSKHWGANYPCVKISFIEDQAVVTKYAQNADQTLKIGDVIRKVNGKDVSEWIARNKDYFPASNTPTQLRNMGDLLLRTNSGSVRVEIERDGEIITKTVNCYPYPPEFSQPSSQKWITPEIGYIYCASINNDVDQFMNLFKDSKGIVIDLRCYPSEFVVFTLGGYFSQTSTAFAKFTQGNITYPGLFTFTGSVPVGGSGNYYQGKVVVLINEETQSQAEYTTMAFRRGPNVTVIGSTTAGADGNVSNIILPGNITTYISGIGVYYPNGEETQRIGIIPDIEVKPTIQGIRDNKDEVLEKALEIINAY